MILRTTTTATWPVASEQASRENMRRGMVGLADEQQVHFQNLSDWIVDL